MKLTREATLLSAVAATTTSVPFDVSDMAKVGLQFLASGISSGNGVFTVNGTIDGTNYVALSMLIDNATNTNTQNLTRVASKTLSTNSSVLVWLDPAVQLKAITVTVTRTTDGSYSCFATASN